MRDFLAVWVGRLAAGLLSLRRGGSAIPGRIALGLSPDFVYRVLADCPVIMVSGSNGKTSTARFLTAILKAHNLLVHSNRSGANMLYGIAGGLLADINWRARLRSQAAVIEVDEGYASRLAERLKPKISVLTNLQVDQLNRYHDPMRVYAGLLGLAQNTTETLVYNGSDPWLVKIAEPGRARPLAFSAGSNLGSAVTSGLLPAPAQTSSVRVSAKVLEQTSDRASLEFLGREFDLVLQNCGLHQSQNALAALLASRAFLGEAFDLSRAILSLEACKPAFGRGQVLSYRGQELRVFLFKNPRSLQVNLDSLPDYSAPVLLGVDEGTPDPSWIYDVSFKSLSRVELVTGTKAYQLACALGYMGVGVGGVEPHTLKALRQFLALEGKLKILLLNYEQSLMILRRLRRLRLS